MSLAYDVALAAVSMNHFVGASRECFAWSVIDARILFPLVGLANGLVDPLVFRDVRRRDDG